MSNHRQSIQACRLLNQFPSSQWYARGASRMIKINRFSALLLTMQVRSVHINYFSTCFFFFSHSTLVCTTLDTSNSIIYPCTLTHLSISFGFLHDEGTSIPRQSSHHFNSGTVAFSRGSCKIAPGISFSDSSFTLSPGTSGALSAI